MIMNALCNLTVSPTSDCWTFGSQMSPLATIKFYPKGEETPKRVIKLESFHLFTQKEVFILCKVSKFS